MSKSQGATSHSRARHTPGRRAHWHLTRRRSVLLRAGGLAALLAVVGPGVLAGLSDDDPAGIATYSILGARYGYELIWVLVLSTAALIVFHELGVRLGIVTGKGLLTLVRERYGMHAARLVLAALVLANLGTLCAEFAGVVAGSELLFGTSRYLSVPLAAIAVSILVLRGSFHRVEHFLLALSSVFVAYVVSGFLAHPDWGAAARGAVVPGIPLTRDALLVAVATVGTTLAPWGLAFIQSYAVDKKLRVEDLKYERVDVIVGAVLTGVIGLFVVVACAATLHVQGIDVNDARDAATALEPLAGDAAATLFGLGFLGAALLATAIVPLSTAYSISETFGRKADLDDSFAEARLFYLSFGAVVALAAGLVLIPGVPLVKILFLSQALNAVLLLVLLPFVRRLGRDRELMGEHALGPWGRRATGAALAMIVVSVIALGVLALL
ncbi:MAG TPA: Nramp family divalent metal transporter [Solirubrobacterales bacterium]|nr:Nramp family divalent metal transporter [Solirubrobacterales bacterium]